jgi:predicted GIY-YIG superfamily endonuclease
MTCGIYCIENKSNGKKYVGQGINVEKRMKETHNSSTILSSAVKNMGEAILKNMF